MNFATNRDRRGARGALIAALIARSLILTASSARADDGDETSSPSGRKYRIVDASSDHEALPPDFDTGWLATLGGFGGYLRQPPGMQNFRTPAGFRFAGLQDQTIQPDRGVGLIGLDLRLGFSTRTPIFFHLLGLRAAYPIGSPYRVDVTDDNGNTGRIRLYNGFYGEFLFPGIGLRHATADIRFGMSVEPALALYATAGTVTQGVLTADIDADGVGFNLDGDSFFCGRIFRTDPSACWLCGYAAPLLYTSTTETFFNGIIIGVRLDASVKRTSLFERGNK